MKKYLKFLLAATLLATLSPAKTGAETIKREFRSTWMATVWGIDWPGTAGTGTSSTVIANQKALLTDYVEKFANTNFTGICFQARSRADALYSSSVAPWSSDITGTRGLNPGWDPLAYAVEQCHKNGIECYAWINPYRWSTGSDWSTAIDKQWLNDGWIMRCTINGSTSNYFNPGLEGVKNMVLQVVTELIDNYDIDGLIIDDYFYPNGIDKTSSAPDYSTYTASGSSLSFADWRRNNINETVKAIYNLIQQHRPDVRFGIGPPGVAGASASKLGFPSLPSSVTAGDWQYAGQYTDPLQWLADGSIDFISPQIYWKTTHSTAPFGPLTDWWSQCAAQAGRHHYASHSISYIGTSNTTANWQELEAQVELSRQYTRNSAPGYCFYSAKNVNGPNASGLGDHIVANISPYKSLNPVITWKSDQVHDFGAVTGATKSGTKLSWTAASYSNRIVRYTVYAVPSSKSLNDVTRSDGDGIQADYLLGVTYTNSYTIPSDKTSDYWYAICVYDGFGNEFTPATVGYTVATAAPATTLSSPSNGASYGDQDITFRWSSVSVDSYTLEIASDANFTSRELSQTYTSTSATLAASTIGAGTHYWRVITNKSGCNSTASSSRSFTVDITTYAPQTTLVSPADGTTFGDEAITFRWEDVSADSYTLEVATSADFSSPLVSETYNATSASIAASRLGNGTFYWHIVSNKSGSESTASASRRVTVAISSGGDDDQGETGYTMRNDGEEYADIDGIVLTSVWFRSEPLGNFHQPGGSYPGDFNRTFVAVGDYLYVSGRSSNESSPESIYLRRYNRYTGEMRGDLTLSDTGKGAYYPCNCVMKDSKGHVVISNLTLNVGTTPINLYQVDLSTGDLTLLASLSCSSVTGSSSTSKRIDYMSIYGDVTSGSFTAFGAVANSASIVKWTVKNGSASSTIYNTISSFCPSDATTLGIAPSIYPIGASDILVSGHNTHPTRYTMASRAGRSATLTDSFDNAVSNVLPESTKYNGCVFFTLGEQTYMVYPSADTPHEFMVVSVDDDLDFSTMEYCWKFPAGDINFGEENNGVANAPVDYLPNDDGTGTIYAYVPGCGIAAYTIGKTGQTGIGQATADHTDGITLNGRVIKAPADATELSLYNLAGVKLLSTAGDRLTADVAPGCYIARAIAGGRVIVKRILIL